MATNEYHETPPIEGNTARSITGDMMPDLEDGENMDDEFWIALGRNMIESSKQYMEANYFSQWEKNTDNFNSKHPDGSRYYSDLFANRSKIFRPRVRAAVRNGEATIAAAFFANADQVNVEALNPNDQMSMASAALMKELIEYRLDNTIPWFQILVGGYQDTAKHGICVGAVEWEYDEESYEEQDMSENGEGLLTMEGKPYMRPVTMALVDKPSVRLVPPENCGFSPAASWIDPIWDSPYFYESRPMTVEQVRTMLEKGTVNKTKVKFKDVSVEELLETNSGNYESGGEVRTARESDRQDPKEDWTVDIDEFRTIWINFCMARVDGVDYYWIMAGESQLLTEPMPTMELFPHLGYGERPYVCGMTNIETHVAIPSSLIELSEDLQAAANTIQNDRFDNVRLAMNKRYFARRSANVDYQALVRGSPGVVVGMDDPEKDIKVEENPDVTGSAYAEQDRVNQDFDEIWGNFSMPSVASSRNLNETVGGMGMMVSAAEKVAEYSVKVFSTTFVDKVLRQLAKMEAYYETDTVVLALAANRADLQGFGIQQIDNDLMTKDLLIKINVGVGATDPMRRINNLNMAMDTLMKAAQMPNFRLDEIGREVFGALGYKDGARFLDMEVNPQVQELQAQIEELQFDKQAKLTAGQADIERERVRQKGFIDAAKMQAQGELSAMQLKTYTDMIKLYLEAEKNDIARLDLQQQAEKAVFELEKMSLDAALQQGRDSRQHEMKQGLLSHQSGLRQNEQRQAYEQQAATTKSKPTAGSKPAAKK